MEFISVFLIILTKLTYTIYQEIQTKDTKNNIILPSTEAALERVPLMLPQIEASLVQSSHVSTLSSRAPYL